MPTWRKQLHASQKRYAQLWIYIRQNPLVHHVSSTRTSSVKMESNNMSGICKILKNKKNEVKCRQNLHSPCFSRASPSSKLAACADPSTKAVELTPPEEKCWKPPHQLPADQWSRLTNLILQVRKQQV